MGLDLATMEKITADVQMNDLQWVEVGEGSYFKVLTVHEPTNTVAFGYKMDPGAPDFPSHFHICRAMAWTVKGCTVIANQKSPKRAESRPGCFPMRRLVLSTRPSVIAQKGFKPLGFLKVIQKFCCKTMLRLIPVLSGSVI